MAIEFPSRPIVLDEPGMLDGRLALLEDPSLAERLIRENPALFAPEPPRTEREILAWTTHRWGPALLAVTAAVSIAAGYFGSGITRGHAAAPPVAHAATVAVPLRHASPVVHRHAATAAHVAAPVVVRHANAAPAVQHHARAPVAVIHAVPLHVAQPVREHARTHPRVQPQAAGAQTADAQLAAWEAAHRAQPRSEPAAATENATSRASSTEPVTTTTTSAGAPETPPATTPQRPPTNPGGVWNERIPGGILNSGMGPVIGVPRDSCTPRGGRTGIVMEAISILTSARH